MKHHTSKYRMPLIALTTTGLAMTLAIGVPAAAASGEDQPFRGNLTGVTTAAPCGQGQLCLTGRVTGEATHFGNTVMTKQVLVTFTGPCAGGSGGAATFIEMAQLTAANGDRVNLSGSGTSCHTANGTTASGTLSPTGGTGRFSDATGTITEDIDAVPSGPATETETVVLGGSLS